MFFLKTVGFPGTLPDYLMIMTQKEKIALEKLNELFASVFTMEETKDVPTQEYFFCCCVMSRVSL